MIPLLYMCGCMGIGRAVDCGVGGGCKLGMELGRISESEVRSIGLVGDVCSCGGREAEVKTDVEGEVGTDGATYRNVTSGGSDTNQVVSHGSVVGPLPYDSAQSELLFQERRSSLLSSCHHIPMGYFSGNMNTRR